MKKLRTVAMMLITAAAMTPAACDFFQSSGPEGGVSPFIQGLTISQGSVTCGREFVLTFQYSDPQDDIEFMRVLLIDERGTNIPLEFVWESAGGIFEAEDLTEEALELLEEVSTGNLDLSVPGRAAFTYAFSCDAGFLPGKWEVIIQLIDERDHESNERARTITLL